MAYDGNIDYLDDFVDGDLLAAADLNKIKDNIQQVQANVEAVNGENTAPSRDVKTINEWIDVIGPNVGNMLLPARNTVLASSVDASNLPDFISAGTGLSANIAATDDDIVITFANGFNTSPYDYIGTISSDTIVSGLVPYATNYIYSQYDTSSGTVALNSTRYPYLADYTYLGQRVGAMLASFAGTNTATSFTDSYNNVWTCYNDCTISNAVPGYNATNLNFPGTNGYAESPAPDVTSGTWTIEFRIRPTDSTRASAQQLLYSPTAYYGPSLQLTTAGKLILYVSSNGSSWNIANGLTGSTVLSDNTWAHIALVFDGATYKVYLNGTCETGCTATSSSSTTQPPKFRLGVGADGTSNDFFGNIEEFRYSPYARYTSNFTAPAAALTPDSVHWFDTSSYKMYYGYPALPWSQVYRVYLGEAVCDDDGVTSVVNYALKGTYNSRRFTITTNTLYTKSHYLGTQNYTSKIMCTAVAGAQLADAMATWNGSSWIGEIVTSQKRNTVNMRTMAGGTVLTNDSGTTVTAVEAEIRVQRGF